MSRKVFDLLTSTGGAVIVVVLVIAGGFLAWGHSFVNSNVHDQLAQQQIYFPPAAAFKAAKPGTEITPSMIPSVSQYAGQQLLTGQQAEAYADNFIAVHIANMTGGKTYSQLSAEAMANPSNTKLQGTVATVFKGETLRSMLLNAYGWWKVSQITFISSLVMFGLGALSVAAGIYGFARIRRERPGATVFGPPAIEQINEAGHEAGASA